MPVNRPKFSSTAEYSMTLERGRGGPKASSSRGSAIDVFVEERTGAISSDLYGYLLENLGTAIYDGIWVGEQSTIPNIRGIRKAVIDGLRDINASVIRWPGGNFADYYDWEDGIGPAARRPRRTNHWTDQMPAEAPTGPQRYDPNLFGTPEFFDLCRLSGGRPFLSVNVRSLTAQSFYRWVEYCNSPTGSTTLAELREKDGSAQPYGVRYWGIGNEVWAAGGNMTAEEYAVLYKRFSSNVPRYGIQPHLVASGPPPGWGADWIRKFMRICTEALLPVPISAISLHYYAALFLNDVKPGKTLQHLDDAGQEELLLDGNEFGVAEWYKTLESSAQISQLIDVFRDTIDEFDPKRQIKVAVDEWGAIYKRTPTVNPSNITGRAVTLRDALAAALTLDTFSNYCDKLSVANYTGLINQEGSLFLADGAQFCTTPVYDVFRMYKAHQGGWALRTQFDVPALRRHHPGSATQSMPHLSGSASIRGSTLTLTVVNPHDCEAHEATINLHGGSGKFPSVATLSDSDICARNTFDEPHRLTPVTQELRVTGPSFSYTFPAASVTCFTIVLEGRGL